MFKVCFKQKQVVDASGNKEIQVLFPIASIPIRARPQKV